VLPAFRPDKALGIELDGYLEWLTSLENVSGTSIKTFTELKKVLLTRIELFKEMGCCASDHALTYIPYKRGSEDELNALFTKK
jgi:glucuronate isomerase